MLLIGGSFRETLVGKRLEFNFILFYLLSRPLFSRYFLRSDSWLFLIRSKPLSSWGHQGVRISFLGRSNSYMVFLTFSSVWKRVLLKKLLELIIINLNELIILSWLYSSIKVEELESKKDKIDKRWCNIMIKIESSCDLLGSRQ